MTEQAAALGLEPGVTSQMIEFDGGSVHLLRGGEGPPLLVLHAAGGAGMWHPFHRLLAERFDVLAPDHPGFGKSDQLPLVEDIHDLVYHYLDLLDRLGLERVPVVGASFGGWLAAELAVHSPHRVEQLVLVSPVGLRIPEHPCADLFIMSPAQKIEALFYDPAAAASLFPTEPDIDFIVEAYRNDTAFARYAWVPFMNDPKLERRLHRVTAPTLVLWPEADKVVPRAHCERYAARIPNARLTVLERAAHAVILEDPERAAQHVLRFLEESRTNAEAAR